MSTVTTEIKDHIASLRLSRPEKMNAVSMDMIAEMIAAVHDLAAQDIRAVVLSGEGDNFCAGIDVTSFGAFAGQDMDEFLLKRTHGNTNNFQEFALSLRKIPVPVIAALQGVCFGAGLQLAAGADIRIAAPNTRLSVMEMKWGLVPDMGGMILLPHLLRSDVLRRLTYTAEIINAEQAEHWGLVTQVDADPLAVANALATQIATKSPSAIRAAKRLIGVAETTSETDVLLAESQEQAKLIGGADQMEVIAAQFQKRDPVFK